jgi:nucleoside permease NupC
MWGGLMFVIISVLSLLLAIWSAYTFAFQATTLAIGRLLVGSTEGTGVQDAITPSSQTKRNLFMFFLVLILFVITTYVYKWYYGILATVISLSIGTAISRVLRLPGSQQIVGAVIRDMVRRYDSYRLKGDNLRANAMQDLIERMKDISLEEIQSEARKWMK